MLEFCIGIIFGCAISVAVIIYELNRQGAHYEDIAPLLRKLALNLKKYEVSHNNNNKR